MPITNISGPLDWWNIMVNEVAGSPWIFLFLSVAILMFLAGRFRMPSLVLAMMVILWLLLMATFGYTWLTILVAIALGIFITWQIIKLFRG